MTGFQFTETMAGTVEWRSEPGKRYPLRFDVTATADSIAKYLADGKAHLCGLMHAPPKADGVPTEGTITIRPIDRRYIRYELVFTGQDGASYELVGEKTIRWLQPKDSFTHLRAEVTDAAGRPVGHVEAYFNLERDLWSFIRSFHPTHGHHHHHDDHGHRHDPKTATAAL
jgi:hypothetical protein